MHDDVEWLRTLVTRLTERHEAGRAEPWAVPTHRRAFVDGQLRAIVGVELVLETVEAKHKLSQNRSEADRAGVVDGLAREPGPGRRARYADLMARLTGRRAPSPRGSADPIRRHRPPAGGQVVDPAGAQVGRLE